MAERVPEDRVVAHVADLVGERVTDRQDDRPVVVLLDGRSGSGKTTLARRLVRRLRDDGCSVTVLHLDHVYPGWDGLASASRLVAEVVLPRLRRGLVASYPSWSWVHDRAGREVRVHPAQVVLVEGVGSGSGGARRSADLLVWLEAPEPVRYRRAMDRDGDGYAPHWQRWADQEAAYLALEQPAQAADLVVVTAEPRGPGPGPAPSLAP